MDFGLGPLGMVASGLGCLGSLRSLALGLDSLGSLKSPVYLALGLGSLIIGLGSLGSLRSLDSIELLLSLDSLRSKTFGLCTLGSLVSLAFGLCCMGAMGLTICPMGLVETALLAGLLVTGLEAAIILVVHEAFSVGDNFKARGNSFKSVE